MAIQLDPEGNERTAIARVGGSLENQTVLEIGCGDGRLTWTYAWQARRVIGIDPKQERISRARDALPADLAEKVMFFEQNLDEYYAVHGRRRRFDRALLAWSL